MEGYDVMAVLTQDLWHEDDRDGIHHNEDCKTKEQWREWFEKFLNKEPSIKKGTKFYGYRYRPDDPECDYFEWIDQSGTWEFTSSDSIANYLKVVSHLDLKSINES